MSSPRSGGTLVMSGASGGGQPPDDRRPDKFTGHYAPDVGPFKPLTGIKMAKPGPVRRLPPVQAPDQAQPQQRPRSNSAPPALFPEPYVAALDGRSVVGPTLPHIPQAFQGEVQRMMDITDRGALSGMRRIGAPRRLDANRGVLGITPDSLSGISPDAPIHLYGHGVFMGQGPHDPQPMFGNLSPQQLSDELIRGGLPSNYRGTMYANGCQTGTLGPCSFAVELSRNLSSQGRNATIRANRGAGHHFPDGTTGVMPPHREEEHARQSGLVASETVDLVHESLSPDVTAQRQLQIGQRQQQLMRESDRIENEFYQRDPSVFVEFPPIRPAPLGRRQSFSGDIQSLLQPMPPPRRRNSIGSLQELGPAPPPPQPPVQALFANQGVVQGRPRSKSIGDEPGIQVPRPKDER